MSIFPVHGNPLFFGGELVRSGDHTHKVSFYDIPHGTDYDKAQVVEGFFPSQEQAQSFHQSLNAESLPAMAAL